jgi:hypothetical protein
MNQQESDQIWQHLQTHIKGFFSHSSADDVLRIEYKPLFTTLLEVPSEDYQNDQQKTSR